MTFFPTRNANAAMHEQAMRNALPLPVAPVESRGNTLSPEMVGVMLERQSAAERAAQEATKASPTIGAGVVNALDVLMRAVEDQCQGRELDLGRVHWAVAEVANLLALAEKRALGVPVGLSFEGPPET